jgi:hypothetical protein
MVVEHETQAFVREDAPVICYDGGEPKELAYSLPTRPVDVTVAFQ